METDKKSLMEYRYLGNTGLRVSAIGFGNMVNHMAENPQASTNEIVAKCLEYGINFFDTAEVYSDGLAEVYLGQAFKDLNVRREDIVVTTKLYFGTLGMGRRDPSKVNAVGLSRKHIIEGARASLTKLQMEYVDVIYAHRYDDDTPLEETIRAFSWLIDQGKAFYWGTSEWTADQITEAIVFARAHGLHEPVTEQPQYNMIVREKFEKEYEILFKKFKYGTTVWSPLAQGVLTGRYNDGEMNEGRFHTEPIFQMIFMMYFAPGKKEGTVKILTGLADLAKELGYSQTQLAIAWVLASKDVSTLILGFSKVSYIDENLGALELYKKWTPEIEGRINALLNNGPQPNLNYKTFTPYKTRRQTAVFDKK